MTQYALSVFAICLVGGVLTLMSKESGATEKTVIGIITAYVIISPLVSAVLNIDIDKALATLENPSYEADGSLSQVAEEAFADGIALEVADRFSLKKDDLRVKVTGFDIEKMSAERINITLSGRAVFADYRGIEKYINSLEMGECKVEIEIG